MSIHIFALHIWWNSSIFFLLPLNGLIYFYFLISPLCLVWGLGCCWILNCLSTIYFQSGTSYCLLKYEFMVSILPFFWFLVHCGESCTSFTQWNSALHPVSFVYESIFRLLLLGLCYVHCILLCLLFTCIAYASYPSIKTKNAFCLRIFKHPLPCSPLPPPLLTTTPISPHSAPTGEWGCISTCVCCGLRALACLSVCLCVCVFVCLFVFVGHF